MAADASSPPTGPPSASAMPGYGQGVASWAGIAAQTREHVPELRHPRSIATYERMHQGDAQVAGLYGGTVQPILEYVYWLDPNGNEAAQVEPLGEDLGLPVASSLAEAQAAREATPPAEGFDFRGFLRDALWAPIYGHYYFELAGDFDEASGLWRLREAVPMHPSGIATIRADRRGALEWVRQSGMAVEARGSQLFADQAPRIPASRLVPFVWWPETTSRWLGRSMLRPLYRNWLCKDVLVRIDVTNHDRAGGVPTVETDERFQGANLDDLQRLASEFRVSEDGGAALPPGALLKIVKGGGTDVVTSMRYHDEQMSQAWQSMVRQLGSTAAGSRGLGETMGDLEALARRAIAGWALSETRRYVIGRWWRWNYGADQRYAPVLRFAPPELEGSDAVTAPGGAEPPDPPQAATRPASPPPEPAAAARNRLASARRGDAHPVAAALTLPTRELRRQPYAHEVAAAVDFAGIDVAYQDAAERLDALFLGEWLPEQVSAIGDGITYTRSGSARVNVRAADLARVRAPVTGVEALAEVLLEVATQGAETAIAEVGAQGVALDVPSEATLRALVNDHAAAVAQQLADGVSVAASRRAVSLVGERAAAEIASEVGTYLTGLAHRWERDQLAGAVQQAITAGRLEVYGQVERQASAYASELLDSATCGPCANIDGHEFGSLEEARRAYPTGGFYACEGGPRCRGTVVLVLEGDG